MVHLPYLIIEPPPIFFTAQKKKKIIGPPTKQKNCWTPHKKVGPPREKKIDPFIMFFLFMAMVILSASVKRFFFWQDICLNSYANPLQGNLTKYKVYIFY